MKYFLSITAAMFLFNLMTLAGTYSGGDGTSGTPYQIANASDLSELSGNSGDWGKYFIQTADITLSASWSPLGSSGASFSGSYNGQGFTISGVSINNSSTYAGLFGYISSATIQNLGVIGVNISANSSIGGLVGYAYGSTITNCYTTGTISGYYGYVGGLIGTCSATSISNCYSTISVTGGSSGGGSHTGGLIGRVQNSSSITTSFHSTGDVYGRDYVGGLIGASQASNVSKCYSVGGVYGSTDVGGLIGYNENNIDNCYSRANAAGSTRVGGLVGSNISYEISKSYSTGTAGATTVSGGLVGYNNGGTTTNSFWDITTSGLETSAGGIGKITSEMKIQSTFIGAGWSSTIWSIGDGINDGYPYLEWQNPSGSPLPVELTSFTASCGSGKVTLKWQTETEVHNYGFEIERTSSQNFKWEGVGFVQGYGNSNSPKEYSFTDKPNFGSNFKYRLKQIDTDGTYKYSPEVEVDLEVPASFSVKQNFPNPFNPTTQIEFSIPSDNIVEIKVFNILGMEVATLLNEHRQAGTHSIEFHASNLSSGIFYYKIVSGKYSKIKKMILLR